ncbi:Aldehyde/histidinol dehydrogenase [Xylogone sp. PMI_703]|nr:Aldehyde/histidinol dehydrogenase [Xylogone sp. PMI_703]
MSIPNEYHTLNPAIGELVKVFAASTDEEVKRALDIAHECFRTKWRRYPVAERASLITKVAALMRERFNELARCITMEVGKLIAESEWEVDFCIQTLEYFASNAEEFLKTKSVPSNPSCEIRSEPIGVILAIEPWNFPLLQLVRVAAPNIMAGNVVIAKPAPTVPQSSLALDQLFKDAGLPEGVYTNLFATIPQINLLVDDFRLRAITLTGSERAGAAVAERAGRNLKKVVLELGGSDPFIVLPDASVTEAAKLGATGRMFNAGQGCVTSKRLIVVGKERGEQFTNELREVLGAMTTGDPMDRSTTLSPIFSERGLQNLLTQVDIAKAGGAKVILGGKRVDRAGYYLEPTILTNITPDNPITQQEIFGPIASVYVVDTEEEAIALANSTKFGLGASVIGTDIAHAKEVAAEIESGMVFINGVVYTSPDVPFGGIKNSGFGRELSELGFNEFVNKKLVRVS